MRKRLLTGLILAHFAVGSAHAQAGATMVFFDWGKLDIQRDYATALDKIAEAASANPDARILIEGHGDRAGSALSNRHASLQRAQIVRDHLIGLGVPATRIEVRAWGEERPLIATADGVREPQNRRVDVTLAAPATR